MGGYQDLTGQRFGRLVAIKKVGKSNSHGVLWECKCDCGKVCNVRANYLREGSTTSCGCYHSEIKREHMRKVSEKNVKHGMARRGHTTSLFTRWECMRSRCYYPKNIMYHRYGGRGIKVCDEWQEFEPFMEWALANGYRDDLALDRIDGDGDYCPENCRWVTQKENNRNKDDIVYLTVDGETRMLVEWAEITNQPVGRLHSRRKSGWSDEEIVYGRDTVNAIKLERHL